MLSWVYPHVKSVRAGPGPWLQWPWALGLRQGELRDRPWPTGCHGSPLVTTEALFGPRDISITYPVSRHAGHAGIALFTSSNNPFLAQTPQPFFSTLLSRLLLILSSIFISLLSLPPPLILQTRSSIDFLPTYSVRFLNLFFFFFLFFRPLHFFSSATPTHFFSWCPPPLAHPTSYSPVTSHGHWCHSEPQKQPHGHAGLLLWHRNHSQAHVSGALVIFLLAELLANRTGDIIFYGYKPSRYLLLMLTQALQPLVGILSCFWVFC